MTWICTKTPRSRSSSSIPGTTTGAATTRGGNDQDLHPCMGETILDDPNNLVTSDVTGIMIKVQTCAVRFLTGGDTSMFGLA